MSLIPAAELFAGARPDAIPIASLAGGNIVLGQLRADVAHNARRLAQRDTKQALLVCEDSYHFIVGLFALVHIGADIVLPPNMQPGTLQSIDARCDVLVTDQARDIADAYLIENGDMPSDPFVLDTKRSRIDFFTSGSTGEMKRVEKSMALLESEASTLDRVWGEQLAGARVFGTVTHQHIFGLAFRVMWPLLSGRCFSGDIHLAWETLLSEMTEGAVIITSPAHLTRLGGLSPLPEAVRPKLIFTAGAPLPMAAAQEAEHIFGAPPVEIFGSTETGAFAWRQGVSEAPVWHPLPGIEISSRDGMLWLRSPYIGGDGTADLADRITLTSDGGFRFEGRADRIVKIEGKRVSLQQIERDLLASPWIEAAAVAQVQADRLYLGAVIRLNEAGRAELAKLGKFRFERLLRKELAATQDNAALPRRWRFVDAMPVDGMGKRRRADVAALLEQS